MTSDAITAIVVARGGARRNTQGVSASAPCYVERFEILIHSPGGDRWVILRGATGLGYMYQCRPAPPGRAVHLVSIVLRDAIRQAELVEWVDDEDDEDYTKRLRPIVGVVGACRALGYANHEHGDLRAAQRPPLEVLCEERVGLGMDSIAEGRSE